MSTDRRRFSRSPGDRVLFGVSGGLAEGLGMNSATVRMGFILLSLFPPFPGLWIYGLALLLMPGEPRPVYPSAEPLAASAPPEPLHRTRRFLSIFNSGVGVVNGVLIAVVGVWGLGEPLRALGERMAPEAESNVVSPVDRPYAPSLLVPLQSEAPDETERLRAVILAASRAEIQARRSLDPTPLRSLVSTSMMEEYRLLTDGLRSNGVYEVAELLGQEFAGSRISDDGSRAEVELTENWRSAVFAIGDDRCVARIPAHTVRQTAYLSRGEAGWVVDRVAFADAVSPAAEPC